MENSPTYSMIRQIFQIAESRGLTKYRIAKETGISEATLSRLKNRERFITQAGLDRLLNYLGLAVDVKETDQEDV